MKEILIGVVGCRDYKILGKEKDLECWFEGIFKTFTYCYDDVWILVDIERKSERIAAIAAKKVGAKITCLLPYPLDEEPSKEKQKILDWADSIIEVNSNWYVGALKNRDNKLINLSDLIICIDQDESFGSCTYVETTARKLGKDVLYKYFI